MKNIIIWTLNIFMAVNGSNIGNFDVMKISQNKQLRS